MKKRFAGLLTALLAALCLLPAGALAEEPEALSVPQPRTYEWSSAEEADNGGLFSVFVAARLYGGAAGEAADAAGSRLEGNDRALYDALLPRIKQAADRGGSTVFTFTAGELGLPTRWTAERLGVSEITQEAVDGLLDRPEYRFDFKAVQSALLADCPYELYWFKRARGEAGPGGVIIELEPRRIRSDGGDIILGLTCAFQFYVARDFREGGDPFAVRSDVASLAAARAAIQEILAENEGGSDYEKLMAYKEAVRGLTDYSGEAGAEYGDPWQLIWVFDGDPNTVAASEGCAKAFQYLCGMGGLEEAECYTVSGLTDSGAGPVPRMWNIVRVGSKNYLADLAGLAGSGGGGGLFLAGAQADYSTEPKGYAVTLPDGITVTYNYDEHYTDPWGKDILLELEEEDYAPEPAPAADAGLPAGAAG